MKTCSRCKTDKSLENFYRSTRRGFSSWCKPCESAKAKKRRKTAEMFKSESLKQCPRCLEIKSFLEYFKSASQKDGLYGYCKACHRLANRDSHAKHRVARNLKTAQRKNTNPHLAMKSRILGLVRKALDRRALRAPVSSVSGAFWSAVGYDSAELAAHLEKQFLPGMSWENRRQWHIDHILPIREFSYESFDCPDFRACWGLANLRPIWAKENLQKGENRLFLL